MEGLQNMDAAGCSAVVAHHVRDVGVVGSSPIIPTVLLSLSESGIV